MKKRLLRKRIKTGGVYLGFHTLRGRKFPHGNFRTSVFCEVKTQIVGKTKFFDSLNRGLCPRFCFYILLPLKFCAAAAQPLSIMHAAALTASSQALSIAF